MAQLIGNQNTPYDSVLTASSFYPELKVSDFQNLFGFLKNTTEFEINNTMIVQRQIVHDQLLPLTENYQNLTERAEELFENQETGIALYQQAVFCFTAATLISNRIATDATKDAADRQDAMVSKSDALRTQGREAIDQLLRSNSGYTVRLV